MNLPLVPVPTSKLAVAAQAPAWAQALGAVDAVGLQELPDRPWRIKMGFDPTGAELHLGHAVGLLMLRRLQDQGHQALVVIGDFTALIGDPTGRNQQRPKLSAEQVARNAQGFQAQALRILDPARTEFSRNAQWLGALGADGMLALASEATLAQMLAREDFGSRHQAQAPIHLHELIYPLLQAMDSVELAPDVEMGGQDQRFNLLMGRELMRSRGMKPQACLMSALLLGLDGKQKMSKSLGNHIGLGFTPAEVFGKSMSISDATMSQWILALGLSELGARLGGGEHPMQIKQELASWLCAKLHGEAPAAHAKEQWGERVREKNAGAGAQEVHVAAPPEGALIWALLRDWGWAKSGNEARQLIGQGALRINGAQSKDSAARIFAGENPLISLGNRRSAKVICEALANPGLAPVGPRM